MLSHAGVGESVGRPAPTGGWHERCRGR